jgi:hypothetical protein
MEPDPPEQITGVAGVRLTVKDGEIVTVTVSQTVPVAQPAFCPQAKYFIVVGSPASGVIVTELPVSALNRELYAPEAPGEIEFHVTFINPVTANVPGHLTFALTLLVTENPLLAEIVYVPVSPPDLQYTIQKVFCPETQAGVPILTDLLQLIEYWPFPDGVGTALNPISVVCAFVVTLNLIHLVPVIPQHVPFLVAARV